MSPLRRPPSYFQCNLPLAGSEEVFVLPVLADWAQRWIEVVEDNGGPDGYLDAKSEFSVILTPSSSLEEVTW